MSKLRSVTFLLIDRITTVDDHCRALHEGCFGAAQEEHSIRNFLRGTSTIPAKWVSIELHAAVDVHGR